VFGLGLATKKHLTCTWKQQKERSCQNHREPSCSSHSIPNFYHGMLEFSRKAGSGDRIGERDFRLISSIELSLRRSEA
jgi:hypothetical protein